MKKLKKYLSDKDDLSLQEKISSYQSQIASILKETSFGLSKNRVSSPLATIVPLAAASLTPFAIAAQCNIGIFTPGTTVVGGAAGSGDDMDVDVDGDGIVDFIFDASEGTPADPGFSDLFMKPRNGAELIAYPAPVSPYFYVTKFDCDDAITSANTDWREESDLPAPSDNQATLDYQNETFGGGAWQDDGNTVTGYVGIKLPTNRIGFMEVTWNNSETLTVNPAATGVQSVAESGNTSVDACDCAALGTAVPVDLVKFQIRLDGNKTLLDWATANEINNAGFEIQRSTDGKDFRKIGWIKGQGNTTEQIDYSFIDDNMQSNVQYYYRLKQMDYDGRFEYSQVVTSIYKDIKGFILESVSPNPSTSGYVTVRLLSTKDQELNITVIDNMGKLFSTKSVSIGEGINFHKLNVNDLPAGNYFVKIASEEQSNYKKIIIQK